MRLYLRILKFKTLKFSQSLFQGWENARQAGEQQEVAYCDSKGLNMPILRVTWEAKTQLRDILITTGFPESCFIPHEFSFSGPDSKLDLVVALLVTGLWPNVCWHREKRKVRFWVFLLICHFHSGIRC